MSGQEASGGKDKSKAPPETPNYAEASEPQLSKGSIASGENSQIDGCDSRPEIITSVRYQAQDYLTDHKIFELSNYLITHLLIDEPDNPIQYLANLIDKCLLFKADLGPPPLIFSDRHIDGIFQSFDPLRTGTITLDQYKMAMKLLGIFYCHQKPPECTPDKVDKETFQAEVKKHLIAGLAEIVGKSSK